jgi:tetratricopeptide (TPR) repeat protein
VAAARRAGDRRLELDALEGLGMVESFRHGGRVLAVRRFEEGLDVAGAAGDGEATAIFANRLTIELVHRLEHDRALASGQAALAAADRAGTQRARARALDGLKLVAAALGDLATLRSFTTELRDLLSASGELWYLKFTVAEASIGAAARGDFDQATALLDEADAVNRRLGDVVDEPYFLSLRAGLERSRGAYGSALRIAREAVSAAEDNPQRPWWRPWAAANLGAVLLELGDPAGAVVHLQRGRDLAERDAERIQHVRCAAHLSWAWWVAGDRGRSEACLDEALSLLGAVTTPAGTAWLGGCDAYDSVARTLQAMGRHDEARGLLVPLREPAHASGWHEVAATVSLRLASSTDGPAAQELLHEAVDAAQAGSLRPLECQAHLDLAHLMRLNGDDGAARSHAAAAHDITVEMARSIDDPDLRRSFLAARRMDGGLVLGANPAVSWWRGRR